MSGDVCEASEGREEDGRGSHGGKYMMVWVTTAVGSLRSPPKRACNFQLLGALKMPPSQSSKARAHGEGVCQRVRGCESKASASEQVSECMVAMAWETSEGVCAKT